MTNMSIQALWLTHFIQILLVREFQLTKFIVGMFSYKAHFRPQISSNGLESLNDHGRRLHRVLFRKIVHLNRKSDNLPSDERLFKCFNEREEDKITHQSFHI